MKPALRVYGMGKLSLSQPWFPFCGSAMQLPRAIILPCVPRSPPHNCPSAVWFLSLYSGIFETVYFSPVAEGE